MLVETATELQCEPGLVDAGEHQQQANEEAESPRELVNNRIQAARYHLVEGGTTVHLPLESAVPPCPSRRRKRIAVAVFVVVVKAIVEGRLDET